MEEAMGIIIPELLGILAIVLVIVIPMKRKKAQQQKEAEELQQRELWQAAQHPQKLAIEAKFRNNELIQRAIDNIVETLYSKFEAKMPEDINRRPRGEYDKYISVQFDEIWRRSDLCSHNRIFKFDLHQEGYPQLSEEEQSILFKIMTEAINPKITAKINSYFSTHRFGNDINVNTKASYYTYTDYYHHVNVKLNIEYKADNGNFKGYKSW